MDDLQRMVEECFKDSPVVDLANSDFGNNGNGNFWIPGNISFPKDVIPRIQLCSCGKHLIIAMQIKLEELENKELSIKIEPLDDLPPL